MPYKLVLPKSVSKTIGGFGLTRSLNVRLLGKIHDELPGNADHFRGMRAPNDERRFLYHVVLEDGETEHVFVLSIDDVTAPGYLFVVDIRYFRKDWL